LGQAETLYEKNDIFWVPLDNAAKIFPAIRTEENTTVFRLTAVLKERVTIKHLITAVGLTSKRYPFFNVTLRKGFFWYYLEQIDLPVTAKVDNGAPCRGFNDGKNSFLFRILVYKNRISAEFSHILTDGYGATEFLTTLLMYYFMQKDLSLKNITDIYFSGSELDNEEIEDAYNRYFKENIPAAIKLSKAFHLPFPLRTKPRLDVIIAIVSVKEMKQRAQIKGVTITDYLVAVYLFVLQDIFNEIRKHRILTRNRILRIQVPINLRKLYSSRTMRNFSLFVMPEIDLRLGIYSFDEILKIVHHKILLEADEKLVNKILSRNVGSERKLFIRGIPLFIKSLVLKYKYYSQGADQYSGTLTNLGKIDLPDVISEKIEHFILTPPPPNKKTKINCGAVGFNDKLVLSFGNITVSKELEKRFVRFLTKEKIKVKVTKY
jgi:NRPS condensation-like uncharacterized protein